MPICGSPWLFAAYRVLRRQSVPWHPPCALVRLIVQMPVLSTALAVLRLPSARAVRFSCFFVSSLCSFQRSGFQDSLRLSSVDPGKRYRALRHEFGQQRDHFVTASSFTALAAIDLVLRASPAFAFSLLLPRKEVIQPHLPIRLPCYDFTPVIGLTFDGCSLAVRSPASGAPNSHGVTGGVYKARERIHRDMLIRDY